ncbi:MAG: hypothetical protein ABFD62_13615, partial [Syntrophaceae bacterium]
GPSPALRANSIFSPLLEKGGSKKGRPAGRPYIILKPAHWAWLALSLPKRNERTFSSVQNI